MTEASARQPAQHTPRHSWISPTLGYELDRLGIYRHMCQIEPFVLAGPCPCGRDGHTFTIREYGATVQWRCDACHEHGNDEASLLNWTKKFKPLSGGNGAQPQSAAPVAPKPKAASIKPVASTAPPITVSLDGNDITVSPPDEPNTRQEIAELAQMPKGIERSKRIERLRRGLGVTKTDVKDEIERHQEESGDVAPLYPHWNVEPWAEPVDTDALLRDVIWKLHQHVVLPYEDILVIALWIMFAWVHDAGTHSPMLLITSAARESGKTTTLSVASFLVPRSIRTVAISEAALYRTIEKYHPTFMIDEFDHILADDSKTKLSEVINSGHTRGDGVLKVNKDTHEPELFSTFGPKAIGMIGRKLPGPTMSRCIAVELRRRKATEPVERFRHIDDADLAKLRSQLLRWSKDNISALRSADPVMSETFRNRHGDNWRIQFAIADMASEEVAEQARNAAAKVEAGTDSRTAGERLLAAIKEIRESDEHRAQDAIGGAELVLALTAYPDSEWSEFGRSGKPISQKQLANMLGKGRFGIHPEQVRVGGRQVRGYLFAHFHDAWDRYL